MDFSFSDFVEIEFPQHKEIVYVLFFANDGNDYEAPFYVGESSRGIGRFGDYISANFSASTDFKVGEAIRYLRERGFKVRIKYKEYEDRKAEERKIINILQKKTRLLNELEGYNYTISNEAAERARLHSFLERLTQERGIRADQNAAESRRINEPKPARRFPTEERPVNQSSQAFIEGCVTSQGIYKTDDKEICELYINKNGADALPHECGQDKPIALVIGDTIYEAVVHETQNGVVWVSSVLKKGKGREKARLVDSLEEIGLGKGDKITLEKNADGVYVLSGSEL